MDPDLLRSIKLEPEPEGYFPLLPCEPGVIKGEESHNDGSIAWAVKLEPEAESFAYSSSFQFDTVQKEELDIEDGYLFDDEEIFPTSSASGGEESPEEGFNSRAEFMSQQRRDNQVRPNKLPREQDRTKQFDRKGNSFTCRKCNAVLTSFKEYCLHLRRHRVQHILDEGLYACDHCDRPFKCRAALTRHTEKENGNCAKFGCDQCGTLVYSQVLYEKHLLRHQKEAESKVSKPKNQVPGKPLNSDGELTVRECAICPVCGKTVYKDRLLAHLRDHRYRATGKYKCDNCSKAFPHKSSLADHQQRKSCALLPHEPKISTCSECGKTFAKKKYLNAHFKRIHKNKTQDRFQCSTCNQAFGSKSHLSQHELIHIPREQQIPTARKENPSEVPLNLVCTECGKGGFPNRKSMITHLKRVHENKSNSKFQCQTCQKSFGSRSDLLAHEQTHDPQHVAKRPSKKKKPSEENDADGHVCPECGKWLPNWMSLRTHEQRVHENKQNGKYQCGSCGKLFGTRYNLGKHERSRHGAVGKASSGP